MQEFHPEINDITKSVSTYMQKTYEEYKKLNADPRSDFEKGATMIAFRLGFEYYFSARDALSAGQIIGGGALIRPCIENLADLFFIFDKPDKYPEAYVKSMEKFRQVMVSAAPKDTATVYSTIS